MTFDFGCYESFYKSGLYYLKLLNLGSDDDVIDAIRLLSKLSEIDSWYDDTVNLLADNNWRSHLGPLVSYIASTIQSPPLEEAIWNAVCRGSWVIPQLIAGLAYRDFDFAEPLTTLLETGVNRQKGDPIVLHVETGPGNNRSRLGKTLNSLKGLGLLETLDIDQTAIDEIIIADIDRADVISNKWYEKISRLINEAQHQDEMT